jgi:chitodextrinase
MKKTWVVIVLFSIVLNQESFTQNAFPGAEGFGSESRCAYAGGEPRILIVNTLSSGSVSTSSNSGSLAWCIGQPEPRIILFSISGIIDLPDLLNVSNPYVNIYGQTAPGDGIIIRGGTLSITTHNVLIQHLKFRVGNGSQGPDYDTRDALKIKPGSKNVIIDHCDMMWSTDETLEIYRDNISNITISNSILAEGLYNAGHSDSPHSMCMLGQDIENISIIKSIFTNSENRYPFIRECTMEIVNCLMYNAHWQTIDLGCGAKADIIGCVSKSGPNSTSTTEYIGRTRNDGCSEDMRQLVYVQDNVYENTSDADGIYNATSYNVISGSRLTPSDQINIIPGSSTENHVLENAGAFNWDRDVTSTRVINDIINETGGYLNSPNDREGYSWITSETRNVTSMNGYPTNPHDDDNGNGFTNLEDWVASIGNDDLKSVTFNVSVKKTGTPLSGASVELEGLANKTTNSAGTVTFTGITKGSSYAYTVSKTGFILTTGNVTINDNLTVNIKLEQEVDDTAPSAPLNLTGNMISPSQIDLTWNASTDNIGIATYVVYRNDIEIGRTNELFFSDFSVPLTGYCEYHVTALDSSGNESLPSNSIFFDPIVELDSDPPTVPENIIVTAIETNSVSLKWSESSDNIGVVKYYIYRNDVFIDSCESSSYIDESLLSETTYHYSVSAVDAAENESERSSKLFVTTLSESDSEAPEAPANLHAESVNTSSATLVWSVSYDNVGVAVYNIYQFEELVASTSDLNHTITGLTPKTHYNYSVTAIDLSGNESKRSNIVSITTSELEGIVYINPESSSTLPPDGSLEFPYTSWNQVEWKEGYQYKQKRNTICYESKLLICENNISIGAYGVGERPIIVSTANDFAFVCYNKHNIVFSELEITAENSQSVLYYAGQESDSVLIEKCKITGGEFCIRIIEGNEYTIQYNELTARLNAIYSMASNINIYYNELTNTETAININDYHSEVKVFNNVFASNSTAISSSYGGLTLYNNIFYLDMQGSIAISESFDSIISDYNIFYPEQTGFIRIGNKSYDNLFAYQSEQSNGINSVSENPMFVDASIGNYKLLNESPAIEAGTDVGLTYDKFGSSVPFGNFTDIGIQETKEVVLSNENRINNGQSVKLFPNPNKGNFRISIGNQLDDNSNITVKFYNITGTLIQSKTIYVNNYSFNLGFLPPGRYFCTIQINNKLISKTFNVID